MIVDVSGVILLPGNGGADCPGNGETGVCCCDECDYMLCCFGDEVPSCWCCKDKSCPRAET